MPLCRTNSQNSLLQLSPYFQNWPMQRKELNHFRTITMSKKFINTDSVYIIDMGMKTLVVKVWLKDQIEES